MRKHLLILLISVLTTAAAFAQVTTGSITGTVRDSKGTTLPGATIVATHVPSGTVYSTTTGATGKYTLPNLRIGGPYSIKVTFIGFNPKTIDEVLVNLGDPTKIDVKLLDGTQTLATVNVTGTKGAVISSERTGPSTRLGQRQLQDLPTVSRSLQDFTRLTPQAVSSISGADGSPLGIQFAGQSNKFNQFTIDGANATDVFGLANSGTNGGQAGINPVPLESIQEVQIILSPYDVTLSGFTGGGINAVSKSGTNDFHGSAYYTYQNQAFVGKNVLSGASYSAFKNYTFGASLGGAIVKNKVFFYANYEKYDNLSPIGFDPTEAGSGSNFSVATLQGLKDFVLNKYGYDVGSYGAMNKETFSNSVFARLDWNINAKNKLTLRHSYVHGSAYNITRNANSIAFSDAGNYQINTTNSSVIELNSTLSSKSSNVLRLTYNYVRDARATSPFPNVQITDGGLTYNLGADFSSAANSLGQDNYTIADNFTLFKDNHTITFGTSNEFYNTANVFQQGYGGAYTYARAAASTLTGSNIGDFEGNNIAPSSYTLTYVPGDVTAKYTAKVHAAQLSIYGQDVWAIKDNLKLTYGLRVDMPLYFNKPTENPAYNADPVFSANPNTTTPKSIPLFSPRVGVNYDVNGAGETQLRGGAGIFTGRAPFVWLSNAYTNTSVSTIRFTAIPASGRFPADKAALSGPLNGVYIPPTGSFASGEIDIIDKNFKVPQTFRANAAVDQKLPFWGLVGTLEGIYTKNINAISYQNLNIGPRTADVSIGSSTRNFYNFTRLNNNFSDVIQVSNTSIGYAYNLTAQLQKPLSRGWTGMVAYTFGESFSLNDGTSSTAASNWRFVENTNGLNNPDEARANYDPGSRIVAYVSKKFSYLHNRLATTIGLVYTGQSGVPISYGYSKNITGDDVTNKGTANNSGNLIYVPSEAELNDPAGYLNYKFIDIAGGKTAAQQWQDFGNFIHSQEGLTKYEGQVIPRNADRTPWENHFDLKVTQDFTVEKNHKISIALDMLNVGNFLNKSWGRSYFVSNQTVIPLIVQGQPATTAGVTSKPTFQFDQTKMNLIDGVYRPYFVNDFTSRWRGQVSIKYSF